jgi:hypothetical protein
MFNKISKNCYKVGDKWVASGNFSINEGIVTEDIPLGPTEPRFKTEEEAKKHVDYLAQEKYKALLKMIKK